MTAIPSESWSLTWSQFCAQGIAAGVGLNAKDRTMQAKTIEGVTKQLGQTVRRCAAENDRRGLFGALLWQFTRQIGQGLGGQVFEQPALVEKVHVTCTNRFLSAVRSWDQRRSMSHAWQVAFRCATSRRGTVAQNLLCAYQAYVDIDLGVALASVLPRGELNAFRRDFQRLKDLLDTLCNERYARLSQDWPLFQASSRALGKDLTPLLSSLGPALHEQAWEFARRLSLKDPDDRDDLIDGRDTACAAAGRVVATPLFPANVLNAILQKIERGTVASMIETLSAGEITKAPSAQGLQGAA